MQLLLGLISSLCSPGEEAGSYALAVESALRLAEAEFQQAVQQNHREEQEAVARTANNYHELLSSVTGQLSQEREARRLVESQDAAMVAQLKSELALERQRREAVQQSLRSALAVKRMGRLEAMAAAGVAPAPPAQNAPSKPDEETVAQYEAQIASLQAEISQLTEALRQAKTEGAPKPVPAPVPVPVPAPEPETEPEPEPQPETQPETQPDAQTVPGTAAAADSAAAEARDVPANPTALGPPSAVVGAGIGEPTQLRDAQPKRGATDSEDATPGARREADAE
jgi:uncharacterized phage infection (PIP) family protein YhgE